MQTYPFEVIPVGQVHPFVKVLKILPPSHMTQLFPFHIILTGHTHILELVSQIFPFTHAVQFYPFHYVLVGQRQFPSIQTFSAVHLLMQWVPFHIYDWAQVIQVWPLNIVVGGHSFKHYPRWKMVNP